MKKINFFSFEFLVFELHGIFFIFFTSAFLLEKFKIIVKFSPNFNFEGPGRNLKIYLKYSVMIIGLTFCKNIFLSSSLHAFFSSHLNMCTANWPINLACGRKTPATTFKSRAIHPH